MSLTLYLGFLLLFCLLGATTATTEPKPTVQEDPPEPPDELSDDNKIEPKPEPKVEPKDKKPEPQKGLTQEDLNKILAKERRTFQAKLDEQKESHRAEIEKLKPVSNEPAPEDLRGQMELLSKRHEREQQTLQAQLQQYKVDLEIEKRKRLETQRDKELSDALSMSQCIDMKAGHRYFLPDIEYDPEEERWMFRTASGNLVSISDGVAEAIPAYLRPATVNSGGSGSTRGSPQKAARQRNLEAEKKKLQELHETAKKSGRQQDLVDYKKQKAQVAKLESELG